MTRRVSCVSQSPSLEDWTEMAARKRLHLSWMEFLKLVNCKKKQSNPDILMNYVAVATGIILNKNWQVKNRRTTLFHSLSTSALAYLFRSTIYLWLKSSVVTYLWALRLLTFAFNPFSSKQTSPAYNDRLTNNHIQLALRDIGGSKFIYSTNCEIVVISISEVN